MKKPQATPNNGRFISPKKRLLFTVITSVICFIACFSIMEFAARLTQRKIDLYEITGRIAGKNPMSNWAIIDAFSAYRAKPGFYGVGKRVNLHGHISTPEISLKKPDDTLRIAFLGESSTAGTGCALKDELTWPWMTVGLLKDKHKQIRFDFINGALSGYTSFESYGLLWSRLRHFSPDIVILNHGWNEMYYFNKAEKIISWRTLNDGSWGFAKTQKPLAVYKPIWVDPLIRWSQLLTTFRLSLSDTTKGEIGPLTKKQLRDDFNRKGLEIWRTQLRLFRDTCNTLGIKLFVIKQPTLITAGLSPADRRRCRYGFHGFDHEAHLEAFSAIYKVIDDEIPKNSIIDLTVLSGRADHFFDHVHPTAKGSKAIASIVADSLTSFVDDMEENHQIASASVNKPSR